MGALAIVSSMLLRRVGYRAPMMLGFLLLATGLTLLSLPAPIAALTWLGLAMVVSGVAVGIAGPPSNNAAVALLPDQVAAISGLRAMFRQTGGIIAITLTAVTIGSGPGQAQALAHVFQVFGVLVLLVTPAIFVIPERRA
jgi:hypothetical protein